MERKTGFCTGFGRLSLSGCLFDGGNQRFQLFFAHFEAGRVDDQPGGDVRHLFLHLEAVLPEGRAGLDDIDDAVGQVEAMKANHHGSHDANGEYLLSTMDPQVLIFQTWNDEHPHVNTMNRLPGSIPDADVFITNLDASLRSTYPSATTEMFRSESGHYVIRVAPGGAEYYVYVLEDDDESMDVTSVFGPYTCR